MLVTPSSITKVWARTQHAPSFGIMWTAVRLHLRNQTMYLPTVSFSVLLSYILWAYFISPLKVFILYGRWFCKYKNTRKQVYSWSWSYHTGSWNKVHANRFGCGLGHVIGSCKAINLLLSQVHLHGPRCRIGCELHCLASFVRIELLSSCQNNCLRSCIVLLNIHHLILLCARHGRKWSCFSSLGSIQVVMYCRWPTCCHHIYMSVQSVRHPSCAVCTWCLLVPQHRSS